MENKPDMVFLDIQLPGKSGVDFLDLLSKHSFKSHFVIVSSSRNFAVDVIKFNVYDYLLKPVNKKELYNIIDNYRLKVITNPLDKLGDVLEQVNESVKIKFISRGSYVIVDPMDIAYCHAEGSYTDVFFTNGSSETISGSLARVDEVLEKFNFMRIGRSALINLNLLRSIDRTKNSCLLVANDRSFEVEGARRYIIQLSKKKI